MSDPSPEPVRPPPPIGPGQIGVGPIWTAVYASIALLAAFFGAFMHLGQGHGLMTPYVLFPSLGAVWFAFRAFYAFTGRQR